MKYNAIYLCIQYSRIENFTCLAAALGPLACLAAALGPLACLAAALGPLAWLT